MIESRASRRAARQERATREFGASSDAVLDVLELTEFAWHDCYGEASPSDEVIDDIFVVANGDLRNFIHMAHLAVIDFRDLRVNRLAVDAR